jgi:hypothetical protein
MASKRFLLTFGMALALAGTGCASVIIDTTPSASFGYSDTTAGDQISIFTGPVANGFQTLEIVGSLSGSTFEVANKVSVTVSDSAGGDTFTVNIGIPAVGLTNLILNGGSGADTFDVTPSAMIPITVNGGGNPQPPPGNVLLVDLTGLTGANLTDTSSAAGFQGSWTFTNAQTVTFSGIGTLEPGQAPEPGVLPLVAAGLAALLVARIRRVLPSVVH